MIIHRSHPCPRSVGAAARRAGSALAVLLLGCSGQATSAGEREAPARAAPPATEGAAPDSAGVDETPAAAGAVSGVEPAVAAEPSPREAPAAAPPLDVGAEAGPAPSPSAPPPAEPAPSEPVAPLEPSCLPPEPSSGGLQLTELVTGLEEPTFVAAAPGDDTRLYVLERPGTIRVVRDGQLLAEPFLDLRGRVATSNEEGLVGLAFHPDYQQNGRFFIQYALLDPERGEDDDEVIVTSELRRSEADPDRADAGSERTLMLVEQPADIHLGGMLAFGPLDGMLYLSRGDGGTRGSQDTERLFGKILRIDVDTSSAELPYGIPEGNMGGDGVLPEIWSLGLRNPWRFSFDGCTGDLYIGDVGENRFEEINVEPANEPGHNYGWNRLEGPECVVDDEATEAAEAAEVPAVPAVCDSVGLTPPTLTYGRDFGCAVTGGYVYRGQNIPSLRGTYLYADFCSGSFGSFRFEGGQALDALDITASINPDGVRLVTSFGVDNAGELYVLSQLGGLYRIDPE